MEELFALQQQLAEIQETSTKYKFSDRIIIDLIEKLIKEYDLKVYHSTDGQSLVTPNQLSKEIHQLIQSNKRVAVNQLPDILGIGFDKIEGLIEKDSNGWVILIILILIIFVFNLLNFKRFKFILINQRNQNSNQNYFLKCKYLRLYQILITGCCQNAR